MRALARAAAALLAIAACGPNPLFKLADESTDRGASSTGASSGDEATSAESSASASASTAPEPDLPPCEPNSNNKDPVQCGSSRFLIAIPDLMGEPMFDGTTCGLETDVLVKRVNVTQLHQCAGDCASCIASDQLIDLAGLQTLPMNTLLPAIGECAWLWHVSKLDDADACKTTALALLDEGDRALRLAVASGDLNPFGNLAELPISVTVTPVAPELCDNIDPPCGLKNVDLFNVSLGRCDFPADQNAEWENILFGGREYLFSARSFTCVNNGVQNFSWYLRREP